MRPGAFTGDVTLPAAQDDLPPAPLTDRIGESGRIDRFAVLRAIGAGGMGVVYAAYDEQLDRKLY